MVIKVYSKYKTGAPKDALKADEERIISNGPLYPGLLSLLDSCQVTPVTHKTNEFLAIHRIELGEVRTYVELALKSGRYINSQWCMGNAPKGIFACDAYVVPAKLYIPSERSECLVTMYVKVCILDSGNTVAVISLHESTNTKDLS
ncbi:TPA: hypothetical protein ACYSI4_002166 [Citrobacter werkmanii]